MLKSVMDHAGSRESVSYPMLQDAGIYVRFAVASYCAQEYREPSKCVSAQPAWSGPCDSMTDTLHIHWVPDISVGLLSVPNGQKKGSASGNTSRESHWQTTQADPAPRGGGGGVASQASP